MILDNECVSPSDYPGKENDYPYRWWEDELWMDENLRLDLEGTSDPTGLTAAEKDFALAHKRAFCRIALCATTARKETERRYPGDWPNGRNDKADAFRHTYWMALCAWLLENNALVREYGEAHESETTEPLEKQMDLHNNDIGISTGRSLFYPTQQEIIEAVVNAMNNGQCWYLNPLVEQTHAIKNDTHLTPTNH